MINCPNCNAQVPAGAAFCDHCGTSLAGVAARPGAGASGGFASPGFGASGPGPAAGQGRCPNCGAPIGSIDVAGKCRSCNAKVTRGDFDWVLSRIEQDEVYQG